MTKTAITNDKPKGEPTLASQIGVLAAMEIGKALGRAEAKVEGKTAPVQNSRTGAFGFKLPRADHGMHKAPKADGTTSIGNKDQQGQHRAPPAISGFKLPKAEG